MRSKTNIRHLTHYILLLIIMVAAVVGVSLFSARPAFQSFIVILASIGYISWGMIHHHKEGSLYFEVAAEYLLFGILGAAAALGLIYFL